LEAFKEAVLGDAYVPGEVAVIQQEEPKVNLPGMANDKGAKPLNYGDPITKDSIVRDIIEAYPNTIPALQSIGMGCLGCPSSTMEPLWQAANIHGYDIDELVAKLEDIRKGA
ncbi:MAG: DUF1858 domain-containing protein, partial [Veillonella sp.]|nr:DUF1858 domain-containing protein [Veillonella sp.]